MTTLSALAPRATPLPGAAIELLGVSKRYGAVSALENLSLSVPQGELLALLGPNGAGKTTAVSLMLGLRPPSAGRVRLLGGDPRHSATRTQVGAMLQDSNLPGLLTVAEVLQLFARFYPAPLKVAEALTLAGLQLAAGKRTAALSGGQRRRLIFALAIIGDPRVLFLDEPTTAMDPQSRHAFWSAVEGMKARGKTIVLTTHHLEEAGRFADRVAVIDRGQLVAQGSPESIRAHVDLTTVRFVSSLTLAELRASPLVTQAEVDAAGRITLTTRRPEALLAQLFAGGAELRGLEVTRASLEDAFLSLTHRPAAQDTQPDQNTERNT